MRPRQGRNAELGKVDGAGSIDGPESHPPVDTAEMAAGRRMPEGQGRRPERGSRRSPGLRIPGWAGAGLATVAAMVLAPPATAAIGLSLNDRIADAAAQVRLPVRVTLADQVDPRAYPGRATELLRALRRTATRSQKPLLARVDGPVRRFWLVNALSLGATRADIAVLASDPAVARVDLEEPVTLLGGSGFTAQSFPPLGPDRWNLTAVGAPTAWNAYGLTGSGVRLGSIDSGVDPANPYLHGAVAAWRDFVGGQATPYDDNGHGTHTIGIMAGRGDARRAPTGVAPGATVLVAKAFGATGQASPTTILAAAEWMADPDGNPATADQPAAVNSSWTGGATDDPWMREIVRRWQALGIVPVFAAGNTGPGASTIGSPASYPESFAVGAIDEGGRIAGFSSRGPVAWTGGEPAAPPAVKPDLAAPGVWVTSTERAGYGIWSGTSMAAPHVAGAIALLRQGDPSLGVTAIEELLRRSARDLGQPGPDTDYGWGKLGIRAAIEAALGAPPDTALVATPPAVTNRRVLAYRVALTGAGVRARVDKGAWGAVKTGNRLRIAVREGAHVIEIQAVSPRGLLDPSPSRHRVIVDRTPPRVSFTWRADGRRVRLVAKARDTLSGLRAHSARWRFSDGARRRGLSVTHVFQRPRPRAANLVVIDRAGNVTRVARVLR